MYILRKYDLSDNYANRVRDDTTYTVYCEKFVENVFILDL